MNDNILNNIKNHYDLKGLSEKELEELALEIRSFLIEKVSHTGGHLASNLGVVELTLSLVKVFNLDSDKIVWDVGHQSYVYKILTGRKDNFDTLRQLGGLSGFPKASESMYDVFNTGHSSTSISAALGMARARDLLHQDSNIIAVIGDGALTGGMAFEALNDIGFNKTKMIIILNDNEMSIAKNVGGMSTYLSKLRLGSRYNRLKAEVNETLNHSHVGKNLASSIERFKDSIKQLVMPSMLFEDMGIKYFGPIDGHNMKDLCEVLSRAKSVDGPVIIHTVTKKGKGYEPAEDNPSKFHGIAPFDPATGEILNKSSKVTFSQSFGDAIVKIGKEDKSVVALTAAMRNGTGLQHFAEQYKDRFFDVGIAEQHAVTMAAGMSKLGLKPIFAVYSTFLQRAFDQMMHDVCLQNIPVVFAIDRAGIVGDDGETHQGIYDISFINMMPNIKLAAPKCTEEVELYLRWALEQNCPVAIRYPRGGDMNGVTYDVKKCITSRWDIVSQGEKIAVLANGIMVQHALKAQEILKEKYNINITIINADIIKPIDETVVDSLCKRGYKLVTIEDNIVKGGFGESIIDYMNEKNYKNDVEIIGFKDKIIPHGKVNLLYDMYGLSPEKIADKIKRLYD